MGYLIDRCQAVAGRSVMNSFAHAIAVAALVLIATECLAQAERPQPRDVAAVQNCLKSQRGKELQGERCIGVIADPCLKSARSTADSNGCADRERLVWDAMLNDTYQRLRDHLDEEQKNKARDLQRAWMESRDKTCTFYWDYFQGTMASPMSAYCMVRETARRAMFLKFFLSESEGR
jgi:uncharacterized protein YecT (DUF1311 family)